MDKFSLVLLLIATSIIPTMGDGRKKEIFMDILFLVLHSKLFLVSHGSSNLSDDPKW